VDNRVFGSYTFRRQAAVDQTNCTRCESAIKESEPYAWDQWDLLCDACCTAVETGVAP
jgi:hypothetical protein